jgi:hypothetical protein
VQQFIKNLLKASWKQDKELNTAGRNTHKHTGGTIYQQLNINAETQFPHPQLLTLDDDHFGRNISRKTSF